MEQVFSLSRPVANMGKITKLVATAQQRSSVRTLEVLSYPLYYDGTLVNWTADNGLAGIDGSNTYFVTFTFNNRANSIYPSVGYSDLKDVYLQVDVRKHRNTPAASAVLMSINCGEHTVGEIETDIMSVASLADFSVPYDNTQTIRIRLDDSAYSQLSSKLMGVADSGIIDIGVRATGGCLEIANARLIVVCQQTVVGPSLEMYYTSADPTSSQSTPQNSIGGYVSTNRVYTPSFLSDSIGTSDLEVPVSSLENHSSTGLIQLGPEIASFNSIDSNTVSVLQRGISPSTSPSACSDIPDRAVVLSTSDIFNTLPLEGQSQYRCVAIVNESTDEASNIKIMVLQNPDNVAQIDIGIEIPAHDRCLIVQGGSSSATQIVTTNFSEIAYTGKYDGSAVFVVSRPGVVALIESFVMSGNQATITVDANLNLIDGETYCIMPAPSARLTNEFTQPSNVTFLNGATDTVTLSESSEIRQYDLFYLWIKRTLRSSVSDMEDTGGIIAIQYTRPDTPTYFNGMVASWGLQQSLVDSYANHDLEESSGQQSIYTRYRRWNLLSNQLDTKYGLLFEENKKWSSVDSGFVFLNEDYLRCVCVSLWYYSPAALGFTRDILTRSKTPFVSPIIAKADSSIIDGEEQATGEWIIIEEGYSDTQNVIKLRLTDNWGVNKSYTSAPFSPGLHHIFCAVNFLLPPFGGNAPSEVIIDIDGKSEIIQQGPSFSIISTASKIKVNDIAFGNVAYKKVQVGAHLSEVVITSELMSHDQSTRMMRYGSDFVNDESTFYDDVTFFGLAYNQPETVSVAQVLSSGSDIVIAKTNGEIVKGFRSLWDVEYNQFSTNMLTLLRPQKPSGVTIDGSNSGPLVISGTSIRIP